jgi:hypothetical protein
VTVDHIERAFDATCVLPGIDAWAVDSDELRTIEQIRLFARRTVLRDAIASIDLDP